jgi:teichuronic acid biosynthesis glycosyltransferase TuaH
MTNNPLDSVTIDKDTASRATSLVVCSLESWSEVRRRIRILVDELVELDPSLEVLFVSPAVDILHELRNGRGTGGGTDRLVQVHPRVHVLTPRKWLPRLVGPFADRSLERQVLDAAETLHLQSPLLWINDASYASLTRTGWPSIYDITDDWLLAPLAPRQRQRLMANEDLLLARSDEVVVCSPDLVRTRGTSRSVELIPNAVDVDLFCEARPRPSDLPPAPVALYVGTLHTWRIDVPLVLNLAERATDVNIVLVGPNSLPQEVTECLERSPNIHVLGPRPYDQVPAYLQHADVVVVPHLVDAFTESLDPIKAYECLAAGRPTVTTPVAGFRELGPPIIIADRDHFVDATLAALSSAGPTGEPATLAGDPEASPIPTWHDRAEAMSALIDRARSERRSR